MPNYAFTHFIADRFNTRAREARYYKSHICMYVCIYIHAYMCNICILYMIHIHVYRQYMYNKVMCILRICVHLRTWVDTVIRCMCTYTYTYIGTGQGVNS